jgi:vacuolar-type H+-ATPase subunit E/Vma4
MTARLDTNGDPLEPLRSALLTQARRDADRLRAAADSEAAAAVAAAEAEAAALVDRARVQGESDARGLQAQERARQRRADRAVVLEAERAAYDELTRRSRDAVRELLADADNRARLALVLTDRLGPGASVTELPDGGMHAEDVEGRSVDASVAALVQGALSQLDVTRLWEGP